MALQRISTELGAKKILQRMVANAKLTAADLDVPSPHWLEIEETALQHPLMGMAWQPPLPWKNLLRQELPGEAVQPISPRDLASPLPPSASSPIQQLPHQWPPDLGAMPDPSPEPELPLF